MSQDIPLGRGDNAPVPTWSIGVDPAGGAFELVVSTAGIAWTRRSDATPPALTVARVVDDQSDVSATVTWPVLTSESAQLPLGRIARYTLRFYGAGGQVQYTAAGYLVVTDGPVEPTIAQVQVPGQPGPRGAPTSVNGKTGESITLSAGDVGAYTTAQVDQLVDAAGDDAFINALIF